MNYPAASSGVSSKALNIPRGEKGNHWGRVFILHIMRKFSNNEDLTLLFFFQRAMSNEFLVSLEMTI